jgi:hypothetical protein
MARTKYVVGPHGSDWQISYEGKAATGYKTQKAAIDAAVQAAHKAGATNPDGAQVLVQGTGGQFRTEWTYGHDPYPPKG